MSDRRLRDLERETAEGDAEARSALIRERVRAGLCPWCGEAGVVHSFTSSEGVDYDAACCCGKCFVEHGLVQGMCGECPGAQE